MMSGNILSMPPFHDDDEYCVSILEPCCVSSSYSSYNKRNDTYTLHVLRNIFLFYFIHTFLVSLSIGNLGFYIDRFCSHYLIKF